MRINRKPSMGMGLASTMMMGALMVTAGFALASRSVSHILISNRLDNLAQARSLAEAAAEMALARALQDPTFGTTGTALQRSVEVTFPNSDGTGRVTFDGGQAQQWKIPISVNNLAGAVSLAGYQRQIPAKAIQVLAEGKFHGVNRRLEAVAYLPPYRYALVSSGKITSNGALQVLGIKDPQSVAGGVGNIPPDQILPGNVGSNGHGANSLKLESNPQNPTLISGDAQSCGTVKLGPATTVEGAVKPNSDPAALPSLNVNDFDPQGFNALQTLSSDTYTSQLTASGLLRRQGDLTVSQGGLNLDSGYLFVAGNLDVWGGLSGKGAVFATGNITLHGMSSFAANSQQALMCQGDLTMDGQGQNSSYFQGLIYTQGDFHASDLTLVGSFLGNKPDGQGTQMSLNRVNVVQNPQAVSFGYSNPIVGPNLSYTSCAPGSSATIQALLPPVDVSTFYNPATDSFDPSFNSHMAAKDLTLTYGVFVNGQQKLTTTDLQEVYTYMTKSPLFKNHYPTYADFLAGTSGTEAMANLNLQVNDRYSELSQQILDLNKLYQKTKMASLKQGQISLDPNQFIQMSDQMRKILWREI